MPPKDAPTIEAFCVTQSPDGPRFTGRRNSPFGQLSCPLNARLKLAYTHPRSDPSFAIVFGLSRAARPLWYGPSPAHPDPLEIQPAERLRPFGEVLELGVNHEPGPVRIIAIFSQSPIDLDAISTWSATHAETLRDLDADLSALTPPVPDAHIATTRFDVVKGDE